MLVFGDVGAPVYILYLGLNFSSLLLVQVMGNLLLRLEDDRHDLKTNIAIVSTM